MQEEEKGGRDEQDEECEQEREDMEEDEEAEHGRETYRVFHKKYPFYFIRRIQIVLVEPRTVLPFVHNMVKTNMY